jgi:hypothetical protein
MALAGNGKTRDAAAEQKRFETERGKLAPETMFLLNNKAADVLALSSATLAAQLAEAGGQPEAAIDQWRRADGIFAALAYDEPPAWLYPVSQPLAAAMLRAGRAADAEKVFRETLAAHPRDGRLLFGLWQSLLAQRRDNEAILVEQQYKDAWKDATAPLALADL